ncbi:uncharacterized protein LOC109859791 isoform X2 [Pseudomyrmex gracilis]|uniref:uncharacterized protein LOC109859791 isoform X2 n=1 Tax=Pseudomyrmex gracilis TaxID=219809 RepID=UPI00099589B0|nr:uncharacterized protein LOC109859791 isoform X2 [Pseudomyrmex gracilis]
MDQISQVKCVSARQNDYLWPDVSKTHLRPQPSTAVIRFYSCNDSRIDEPLDRTVGKSFEWCQVVPAMQRLEPKLCSTKIRSFPEVEPTRFEQPRKCVKKIEVECPDLHKILEKLLPEEKCLDKTTARVEADRWKTTYQIDFSDPAARMAKSIAKRDKLCRIDDTICSQKMEHRLPVKIIVESDCLPKCCLSSRYNGNSLQKQVYKKLGRKNGKKCMDEKIKMQLPAWKSEYQDSISKIGQSIIKTKLHQKRSAAPMLTISY